MWWTCLASFATLQAVSASFAIGNSVLVQERVDPIKSPGKTSGHVHTICGGNAFGTTLSYDKMIRSTCTTTGIAEDMSNYWTPMVFFHRKDGKFIAVDPEKQGLSVYYDYRKNQKNLQAFPRGFRMVAGSTFARALATPENAKHFLEYDCLGGTKPKTLDGFPKEKCPYLVRLNIFFPSCGNGQPDSDDHQSHVKYAIDDDTCPKGYEHRYPELHYELWFNNKDQPDKGILWSEAMNPKQPFVLSNGDPTGFAFHADVQIAWKGDALDRALKECNGAEDDNPNTHMCKVFTPTHEPCEKTSDSPDLGTGEKVTGWLDKLPGCNPITTTEADARKQAARRCPL